MESGHCQPVPINRSYRSPDLSCAPQGHALGQWEHMDSGLGQLLLILGLNSEPELRPHTPSPTCMSCPAFVATDLRSSAVGLRFAAKVADSARTWPKSRYIPMWRENVTCLERRT
jgi:hypothetical protein